VNVVGIVGSRGFGDLAAVARFVTALASKYPDTVVVSGGAPDVDQKAEDTARLCGLAVISYRPYKFDSIYGYPLWTIETVTHGEAAQAIVVEKHRRINPPCFKKFAPAAFCRNGWIVEDSHRIVAFWDGASTGTRDTIKKAERAGRPTHIRDALGAAVSAHASRR
jgi:hypothetical protein